MIADWARRWVTGVREASEGDGASRNASEPHFSLVTLIMGGQAFGEDEA